MRGITSRAIRSPSIEPAGYSVDCACSRAWTASRAADTVSTSAKTIREPESAIIRASSPDCEVGFTGTATAWVRSTAR